MYKVCSMANYDEFCALLFDLRKCSFVLRSCMCEVMNDDLSKFGDKCAFYLGFLDDEIDLLEQVSSGLQVWKCCLCEGCDINSTFPMKVQG